MSTVSREWHKSTSRRTRSQVNAGTSERYLLLIFLTPVYNGTHNYTPGAGPHIFPTWPITYSFTALAYGVSFDRKPESDWTQRGGSRWHCGSVHLESQHSTIPDTPTTLDVTNNTRQTLLTIPATPASPSHSRTAACMCA